MSWVAVAVIGGAVIGGVASNSASKKAADAQTKTTQMSIDAQKEATKLDPRIDQMIYGAPGGVTGEGGIVGRIGGLLDQPTSTGTTQFRSGVNEFMGGSAADAMRGISTTAQNLQGSNISPAYMSAANMAAPTDMRAATARPSSSMTSATVAPTGSMQTSTVAPTGGVGGVRVNAPAQNKIDLTSNYERMLQSNPADNPYLTAALQGGINQSQQAFGRMQEDATSNIMKNVLPSIRSNSILTGQYGGSRQGVAEGGAIGELAKQMARASSDFGQRNTDAIVGAQAGAFESGQNRALSAMSGLGAQQYGVAQQDAQMAQQAAMQNAQMAQQAAMQNAANQQQGFGTTFQAQQQAAMQNAANQQQANAANYQGLLGADMSNAGFQQQANQINYAGNLQANQANAGFRQGASTANLGSQNAMSSLNSQNQATGAGLQSGLLNQAYGFQQGADNANINRVGAISGLLQPYAGKGSPINVPTQQPIYNNMMGSAIGGATAGLGLYNAYQQANPPAPAPAPAPNNFYGTT